MDYLQRGKLLLLAPKFYGYENEIIKELERLNFEVSFINTDPSKVEGILNGIVNRIIPNRNIIVSYIENRIRKSIKGIRFDIVLVISSWTVTSNLSHTLRANNLTPQGRMILYYWDSLERLNDDRNRWKDFDFISSFDRQDALSNNKIIHFLPLFYCKAFWNKTKNDVLVDLQAIGSFRLERLDYIERLRINNPELKIHSYRYESKLVFLFHKTFRKKYKRIESSKVRFAKLSFSEVVQEYSKSKAVLDISATGQSGLTMRTIETLAMHKKIVTSNADIVNYDFYNEQDIYIIPKGSNILPSAEWFCKPFAINDSTIEKYSINNWLLSLIEHRFYKVSN